jgi:hypothetical protein
MTTYRNTFEVVFQKERPEMLRLFNRQSLTVSGVHAERETVEEFRVAIN